MTPLRVRASSFLGRFAGACALYAVACTVPEADPSSSGDGGSTGAADDGASDDGASDDGASDDTAGADDAADSGGAGPGGTDTDAGVDESSDSGVDPAPLDQDVFFFVRDLAQGDALWAYDLATDAAHEVTALDGTSDITSVAIDPSRSVVAIASDYGAVDYQASETIYGFAVNDALVFDRPSVLMPAIPKPIGVGSGYKQQVDDLQWHPDGSSLWFGHAFQPNLTDSGGGTLARLDLTTGSFELYVDAIDDCIVNTGPSPSPDGTTLLGVRGVCIDSSHEGLVAFGVPPAAGPGMVVPSQDMTFATPRWLADGAGIVFGSKIDYDENGDGTPDLFGDALLLLEVASGQQYVLVPPSADATLWDFAVAPDGERFVLCVNQAGARDLLLLDLSGAEASMRWLTDDGGSCKPSW